MARTPSKPLSIDTLTHDEASRRNAPTAELEPFVPADLKTPIQAAYARTNRDLDPQLVWRGKDMADWSDLIVEAPPLYIQEKIHPKAIIEDLKKHRAPQPDTLDLFADFNGIAPDQKTEFYAHDQHWSNRMILGDGLKVMASLAEREGLKGKVQCIYIDPPYGIKFNSNFQWSTTSRDVKDGKADHLTREPEQVKAFRDTWADGIHSYLTYLRDRLTVARDLLTESGSVFVQIGDENVHRVRALMDEVFGAENHISDIVNSTTTSSSSQYIDSTADYIIWYGRNRSLTKYRPLLLDKSGGSTTDALYRHLRTDDGTFHRNTPQADLPEARVFRIDQLTSQTQAATTNYAATFEGKIYPVGKRQWATPQRGLDRLIKARRVIVSGSSLAYVRFLEDYSAIPVRNIWLDTGTGSFTDPKVYVVQSGAKAIQRCILMTTDPGDLVLDPTCGSGTTAYVAEQWGRRWITMDTSRVALALARARIMGARYPWYLLADSREGQVKEGEVTRSVPADTPVYGRLRQGFVYKRVPHITLKSIANNAEIDTIWEAYQARLGPLLDQINAARRADYEERVRLTEEQEAREKLGGGGIHVDYLEEDEKPPVDWREWDVPRNYHDEEALLGQWWTLRIARQNEIDASIAAKADTEYLYDQPYEDKARVRVAGPFTVESLSPHRVPAVDLDDSLFDEMEVAEGRRSASPGADETVDFVAMVLENLRKSGVQQAHKADRLVFSSLKAWPGEFLCAEGRVRQASEGEGDTLADSPERRAAILVGPEYGTVSRANLTAAAREAAEAGFDLLIAAAFNFDAQASEFHKMGALTVLQARINPDLHMPDLANTGAGNLFTVFGEPDIVVHDEGDGLVSVEVAGVDMYKAGTIESSSADDIAVWFVDTDYDYESFFVRQAYFPGASSDPYKALRTTLKAEIDEDAWASLKRTRSRPFARPKGGKIAVKVINHLGDEVMKVVGV